MKYLLFIRKNIYLIPLTIALSIVLNIITNLSGFIGQDTKFVEASETLDAYGEIGKMFLLFIFAPIMEELIYRKLIFKISRKYLRFIYASILSSFIFGIVHFNITQFIYAFLMGLVLSLSYEVTGFLIVPIFMHIIANLSVYYIYGVLGVNSYNIRNSVFMIVLCIAIIFLSFYRFLQENKTSILAIISRK